MNIFKETLGYKSKIAIIIVGSVVGIAFLVFTGDMARQLKKKEYFETKLWSRAVTIAAQRDAINAEYNIANLINEIVNNDNNISAIITDKDLNVHGFMNVQQQIIDDKHLLRNELEVMTNDNEPILIDNNGSYFYIFYRESNTLKLLRYLPYVQFGTLIILIVLISISYSSSRTNEQNRVWVGMAKETAHQLGTPSSSLLGWLEYLKSSDVEPFVIEEIGKDVSRLLKVVDRFSKIGAATPLMPHNVIEAVATTVDYFQTRIPKKVELQFNPSRSVPLQSDLNPALFEWVMENLIKNSIDSLSGEGEIKVSVYSLGKWIYVDIADTGKGIAKSNFKKIFTPGFTTKTRGWGLGLSLSNRIIKDYHQGRLFVALSEIDKGTTMRIMLKKI